MTPTFDPRKIEALVGLGNPTEKYSRTYHNAGYLCLDEFVEILSARTGQERDFRKFPSGKNALFSHAKLGGMHCVKPLTFMNDSGKGVAAFLEKFGVKPKSMLIIHDDSDLTLPNFKISFARGDAGHNGVRSVFAHLHTRDFWRLRIGTRNKVLHTENKALDFALESISEEDLQRLREVFALTTRLILGAQ